MWAEVTAAAKASNVTATLGLVLAGVHSQTLAGLRAAEEAGTQAR